MNLFKYIVDTIIAFASAFDIPADDACAWLCDHDPRLASTIARAKSSRDAARERVTRPEPPSVDDETEIVESDR